LAEEWTAEIWAAQKGIDHVEELCAMIAAGTASADDLVEAADLLRHGVSLDDGDIVDEPVDSEDKSTDREEEEKAKTGMKRKCLKTKTERKRAEPRTGANTEKRRRGGKAKVVTAPAEWTLAVGECR
jgi:hypothetical protein